MKQQQQQPDAASVEGLPPYVTEDARSPIVQEKWADIEATLPPYEPAKTRAAAAAASKRRLFARRDWVRIATAAFAVFICVVVPAVVVGVVFGMRTPSALSPAPISAGDSSSTTTMSDPVFTATDQDGRPLFAGGTDAPPLPPTDTRPGGFEVATHSSPAAPSEITIVPSVPGASIDNNNNGRAAPRL